MSTTTTPPPKPTPPAKKPVKSTEDRLTLLEMHVNSMRGIPMGEPPVELLNTEVLSVPIGAVTGTDKPVALPPGDTFTATSSDTAVRAGIGADKGGGPVLVVRPMKRKSGPVTIQVADSQGLLAASVMVEVVVEKPTDAPTMAAAPENPAPAKLVLDMDKATSEPQLAPKE